MKEHTLYALQSRYTSSAKYDAKHMFSYLDFRCYFEANGQNHIHFWLIQVLKKSMTGYFLTFRPLSSKLEFVYSLSPVILRISKRKCSCIFSSINSLLRVLNLVRPLTVLQKNCHKENSRSEQRTMHVLIRIWSHRTSGSVCFFGNDRSSHSRIQINLDPMSVYYEWASD